MNHDRTYFPMMVNLTGKSCLVVGAGKVAAGKIASLLAYGAKVTVVSSRSLASIHSDA
jgi:precorrin-2 dehydrogenase/sirohydrochlorin ferrochelatase